MDGIQSDGLGLERRLADFQALQDAAKKRIEGRSQESATSTETQTFKLNALEKGQLPLDTSMANVVGNSLKKVNEMLLYHHDLKPNPKSNTSHLGNYVDKVA